MSKFRWLQPSGLFGSRRSVVCDGLMPIADEVGVARLVAVTAAPRPDLRIDGVEIEGHSIGNGDEYGPDFKAGDEVSLEWDVDNIGDASAGSSRVAIRLISDVDGMTVDTNLTSSIAAGGSDTNETDSFIIPATLSPGLYGIQIIADDRGEVSESNEGNNEFLILIRVDPAGRPDLIIDDVELNGIAVDDDEEYAVQAGQQVTVTWDVDNDGDGDAGSSRVLVRLINDVRTVFASATNTTSSIDAGDSDTNESVTLTIPAGLAPGLYGIEIIADDQDVVDESSENNNDFLFLARVGGPPPPPAADDFRDEAADTSAPLGSVTVGNSVTGIIGPADANDTYGDKDVFKVRLEQGQAYEIRLLSTSINGQSLQLGIFTIRNPANFDQVLETSDVGSNVIENFIADSTGDYYIRVGTGGAATDQGGYRLSVSSISSSGTADDFPDYLGDPGSIGSTPTLNMGPSRTGVIETVGDTDIFQVTLQAHHSYQFSLDSNSAGTAGALSNLYMTLRSANDFGTRLREDGGIGQAVITFNVSASGAYYVRVGSGSSTGTGGYRLDVYDQGVTAPPSLPPPPQPTSSLVDDALGQFDYLASQLVKNTALMLVNDSPWNALAAIMVRMNDFQAAELAGKIGKHAAWFGFFLDIGLEVNQAPPGGKARAAFIALMDDLAGIAVTWAGSATGGGLAAVAGSVVPVAGTISAGIFGMIAGGLVAHTVYERGGASHFIRESAGTIFDNHFGIHIEFSEEHVGTEYASISEPGSAAVTAFELDEGSLVRFDEGWYLSTYPDAAGAIATGTSGSAYAHFLTVGIDLGHQPNPAQAIARSDLAIEILNNDPSALDNSALLRQGLSSYAGDGLSTAETAAASAVNGARNGPGSLAVDATLSAIASRKAIDLVANFAGSAVNSAHSHANGTWAEAWSNGNQLTQQFRGTFEALLGADTPAGNLAMFVVSSSSGSSADVLARLQGQSAFSAAMANAAFDTLGIAEFGGVWVVILADRVAGYLVTAPGPDALTTASIYGSNDGESLYSGMRTGRLFGLDGNDTLVAGLGTDHLDGGTGNDIYAVNGDDDLVVEARNGGRDTIFATVSYEIASEAEIEILSTIDYNGFLPINLGGNAFSQEIWGNAGPNILEGGGGGDLLVGGAGNDRLIGGGGSDRQYGGPGADTFVLTALSDSRIYVHRSDGVKFLPDIIADFVSGEDKLDLSAIDAIRGTPENDAFTFIGHAAFSNHAGELKGIIENGLVHLVGDVDGDGGADFQISIAASIFVADIIL